MSRTYRNREKSFEEYYKFWLSPEPDTEGLKEYIRKERYKYKTKSVKYYSFGLPKSFRKIVNKNRRTKDKHEIWKSINFNDYPEQCSSWGCKDSDTWGGYW